MKFIYVDEAHPAVAPAEIAHRMGIGQHLIVDLKAPARIAQLPEEQRSIVNRYQRSMAILGPARDRLVERFRKSQA